MSDEERGSSDADEKWQTIIERLNDTPDAPEPTEEMEAKLKQIEERATRARSAHHANMAHEDANPSIGGGRSSDYQGLGTGLSAAYAFIGTPIGFFLIGLALDKFAGTTNMARTLALVGVGGGAVLMLLILNKQSRSEQ